MRTTIKETFGIDALDIYGFSEVMGPGVGSECTESKDGPHIWEDQFRPEIVDALGHAVPDGQQGELVFTTLIKEALPIIRYRTHDISTLLPGTGRPNMRRIMKITGRNDDMIILRGVNLFPTQIEELALAIDGLSPHFVLELSKEGRMDCMTVRIEPVTGISVTDGERTSAALVRDIKTRIGSTVTVELVAPARSNAPAAN